MNVQYNSLNYFGDETTELDPINYWVYKNLERDGLETKIEKLIELMGIVVERHLTSYPKDVGYISNIIDCDGKDHKITEDENLK